MVYFVDEKILTSMLIFLSKYIIGCLLRQFWFNLKLRLDLQDLCNIFMWTRVKGALVGGIKGRVAFGYSRAHTRTPIHREEQGKRGKRECNSITRSEIHVAVWPDNWSKLGKSLARYFNGRVNIISVSLIDQRRGNSGSKQQRWYIHRDRQIDRQKRTEQNRIPTNTATLTEWVSEQALRTYERGRRPNPNGECSFVPGTVILLNLHINQRILIILNPHWRYIARGGLVRTVRSLVYPTLPPCPPPQPIVCPHLCQWAQRVLVIYINPIIAWRFAN